MKKFVFLFIIIFISKFQTAQVYNGYSSPQDTCLNKSFSLVFYVVLDSSFTPGIATPVFIDSVVSRLNNVFSKICVTFLNCSTVYIPHYRLKGWYPASTETLVTSTWYTPNTINIYLPDTVYPGPSNEPAGYTYRPTPANLAAPKRDLIVMGKPKLALFYNRLMQHLMGDYLGLPHTSDEINPGNPANPPPPANVASNEFATQTMPNCAIHGDGFCDTEADSGGAVLQDGQGNYYVFPTDNLMSLYDNLRLKFTAMQYHAMVYNIMTKRLYLH